MKPALTAVISKEWKQRILLLILMCTGMGSWFLYDGLIAYPKNNVRAVEYFALRDNLGEKSPELETAWLAFARERGWRESPPKKIYSQDSLRTQLWLGLGALLVAGAVGIHYLRSLSLTTRLVDDKIILPNRKSIPINQVRGISKKRWKNKGIADLVYEPRQGQSARFILDDYKFIGVAEILAEVEKSRPVPPDASNPKE
jgi:hypothetical protein